MDFETLLKIENESERVAATYEIFNEDTRLSSRAARVEFLTTLRYLEKYLSPSAHILDVGAGTGAYSIPLAEKGYAVSALELSEANIRVFEKKLRPDLPVSLRQGNALDLSSYADASFDAVLLLGPLYHLSREEDRVRAIAEATRVCKPDGMLFFAFIENDMVPLTELCYNPHFFTGDTYDHATFKIKDFPFVFLTLDDCRETLRRAGIRVLHEVAADGVSELLADKINAMSDESYAQYLRYHFYCCEKPEMLGRSNHLLFVGKK